MRISQTQAQALATLVNRLRPDWDHPGIMAAIAKSTHLGDPFALATALITLAENQGLNSPALLPMPGKHWAGGPSSPRAEHSRGTHNVRCHEHPAEIEPCRVCATLVTPPTDDVMAALRATARAGRPPKPRFEVTPKVAADRETRRAQLRDLMDAEASR